MEPPSGVGKKVYLNGTGHMTKMAAMLHCKNVFTDYTLSETHFLSRCFMRLDVNTCFIAEHV